MRNRLFKLCAVQLAGNTKRGGQIVWPHKNAIHALYSCNLLNMLQAEGCLALR